MVTRVINLFYREVRGLHQAAYVLALFALASQILAVVRDRLLAHQFGAGPELDMYYAAFRIPDLLYVLFASVLSVYVLLPFVSRARTESEAAGKEILSQMLTFFLLSYGLIALGALVTAPYLVSFLFPGFTLATQVHVVLLMRILLLQPFLLGLSSLLGVVTQIQHRFVIYALSPVLYNVGIIIGAIVLYPRFGLPGLVYGVVLGALLHVVIQWPLVRGSTLSFGVARRFNWKLLREIALVAIPRAITLSLGQVHQLVLVSLASTMAVGSVAVLQFAYNLQSVPLSIIGMSYSVAAFPTLADLLANEKRSEFNAYVLTALRHIMFWSFPIITLVIVLRAQIVRVLLGSGSFDWSDTRLTAAAMGIFVISLLAQSILLLLVRAFYAGGHTKLPLLLTLFGSVVGSIVAYGMYVWFMYTPALQMFFATLMRLDSVKGSEVLMLPIGFTTGMLVQVVVMLLVMARTFEMSFDGMWRHFCVSLAASLAGGAVAYLTLAFVVSGVNQDRFVGILLQGITAGVFGLIGTVVTYRLLGSPELHEIYQSLRSRFMTVEQVVAPQPTEVL
jgi:putative peptidoglycan lipid II flippase